jgi:hypothetical protein
MAKAIYFVPASTLVKKRLKNKIHFPVTHTKAMANTCYTFVNPDEV